jgi:glycosyltransferase involved in cell wall biosynthesis
MRILTLSYDFPPLGSGASAAAYGLSRQLVRLGHAVDVVTMGFRGLPREQTVEGVRVLRIPCLRRRRHLCTVPEAASYLAGAGPTIRRLTAAHRYDVVHAHFILPGGFMAWRLHRATGLPYVITAHGSDVPGHNPYRFRSAHRLLAPIWDAVVRDAQQVVCPSEALRSLVRRRSRLAKTSVIPNGIEPDRFTSDRAAERAKRILLVGRLVEGKGAQDALSALNGFTKEYELHIVGDGPYLPTLRELARPRGRQVRFWGWLESGSAQLKELYETSSAFLLPSEAENCPIALLEAMAAGLPIITTQGTGCEEVVGDAALLVPPSDPGAIRSALQRLLPDAALRRRLGEAGRQRLEAHFSWTHVTQQYLAAYRNGRPAAQASRS